MKSTLAARRNRRWAGETFGRAPRSATSGRQRITSSTCRSPCGCLVAQPLGASAATTEAETAKEKQEHDDDEQDGEHLTPTFRLIRQIYPDADPITPENPLDVLAADRVSEDDSVRGYLEFADRGIVRAGA